MARTVTPLKLAVVASGRFQRDIAAEIGVDQHQFSRWVNGLHCPEPSTRQAIADVLGRQVTELWPQEAVA